jgi:hypothetical protein
LTAPPSIAWRSVRSASMSGVRKTTSMTYGKHASGALPSRPEDG